MAGVSLWGVPSKRAANQNAPYAILERPICALSAKICPIRPKAGFTAIAQAAPAVVVKVVDSHYSISE